MDAVNGPPVEGYAERQVPGGQSGGLRAIKTLHTAVWAFLAGCILAIPVASVAGRHRLAAGLAGLVALEVVVLAFNHGRCPLTALAGRHPQDQVVVEHERADSEIAEAVLGALKWDVFVPETVTAEVQHGAVTLEGQVTWNFQRDAAERCIRYLSGVTSVYNAVTLKPDVSVSQVKEKVQAALQRQAKTDAKSIHVETSGGKVTLTGHASSWQSIEDAASAAWAAPGVTEVVDRVRLSMNA